MSNKKDNNQTSVNFFNEGVQSRMDFQNEQEEQDYETEGPVTCLGITFTNDSERRTYFREELRKRLPELKKIEGFPIGNDDDIINLSDPPYYTACPNPWLKEIVREWESQKQSLEKSGIRDELFGTVEPYAYGVTQGKNSAIYNAHSYHTKVPYEIIIRYLLHYTQPGDIVYDGFSGSGMTSVAATACDNPNPETRQAIIRDFDEIGHSSPKWGLRHSICSDLSPLCYHIATSYNINVDTKVIKKVVGEIVQRLEERFGHFYKMKFPNGESGIVNYFVWSEIVSCKNCGKELNVHDLYFDYKTNTLNERLVCPHCGTVQKETETGKIFVSEFDECYNTVRQRKKYVQCKANCSLSRGGRAFNYSYEEPIYPPFEGYLPLNPFPKEAIVYRSFDGCELVADIYPKRTRYVLGYLYKLINENYEKYKQPLMFIFSSMLPKLTIMNRYMPQHGSRALVGPMANVLYIPPQYVENNPISQFEYQANKVIRAFAECKAGASIQVCSASHTGLDDCSIDYIFTDPPFGANIMYSELNVISESWLNLFTNKTDEAISNKAQKKELHEYQEIMTRCFSEYYRILKPGKCMTVEFSNTSAAFWNSIQTSIQSAGFIISAVTDLNKERGGLFSMITKTSVKQDLAISCYKPSNEIVNAVVSSSHTSIWEMVENHLNHVAKFIHKDGKTIFIPERDPRIIYYRVISFFIQNGQSIPMSSIEFQQGLRDRFIEKDGMFFTASQAVEYEDRKKNTSAFVPMGIIISDEANGIQWLRNELSTKSQTYQDLQPKWMQALTAQRKGDQIPGLDEVLAENFIKEPDGKWRIPNANDEKDLEILRTKALLKEFNLYVVQASKPKSKIKEARVEALRAGFKQCYIDKDFKTIVMVGDKIPENLLTEDEVLLQYYDIASSRV